jgi:DNA-binding MarR family transcriptional regulator
MDLVFILNSRFRQGGVCHRGIGEAHRMGTDGDGLLVPQYEIERMQRDFAGAYDPLSIQLLFSIRALGRRINDAASAWLAPFGLTATQYNYLAVLYANRDTGMSPTQIGAVIHTVSGTVTSMINALEREKLVRRAVHATDRRSAVIRLTPRGEKLFHAAATAHHEHISAIVGSLDVKRANALLSGILDLGDALAKHAGALDTRPAAG